LKAKNTETENDWKICKGCMKMKGGLFIPFSLYLNGAVKGVD